MQRRLTFRVFVSSTFSDLAAERNALQERVFPKLRDLCLQHGARFQAVDLRWGISEEAALDQQTMNICLQELKRCQHISPRPNFIVLLGDRYGWRPLPLQIPASEFEQILEQVDPAKRELLAWHDRQVEDRRGWYRRDDNAVPATYLLQPRRLSTQSPSVRQQPESAAASDPSEWEKIESELGKLLRDAARSVWPEADDPRRQKFEQSATHQEIDAGALQIEEAASHVYCYVRSIAGLPNTGEAWSFRDVIDGRIDEESVLQIASLKTNLRKLLPPSHYYEYQAIWSEGNPVSDLDALCRRVEGDLRSLIELECLAAGRISELDCEIQAHERFGEDRSRHFVGRVDILEEIRRYLMSEKTRPLLLHGPSGCGKSATIAKAFSDCADLMPAGVRVHRFVGTTPGSSSLPSLLASVCQQIQLAYGGLDDEALPMDLRQLIQIFLARLSLGTAERPLWIFLDGLDQLNSTDAAIGSDWLPKSLGPHTRIVVSVVESQDEAGNVYRRLCEQIPAENVLPVGPLTSEHGDQLLTAWLDEAGRDLQTDQRKQILDRFSENGSPLYLKLAFEATRQLKSYDPVVVLPNDTPGMLQMLFEQLEAEKNHGQLLTNRTMAYLAASRNGLAEDELLDVLSRDNDVMNDFRRRSPKSPSVTRIPIAVWSRLRSDLEPYLTTRRADETDVLSFYHRQVRNAVVWRYLGDVSRDERQRSLAEYFRQQPPVQVDAEGRSHENQRMCSELPWLLVQTRQWQALADLLSEPDFFRTAYAIDSFALLEYWNELEQAGPLRSAEAYREFVEAPAEFHEEFIWNLANFLEIRGDSASASKLRVHQVNRYGQTESPRDQLALSLVLCGEANSHRIGGDFQGALVRYHRAEQLARHCGIPAAVSAAVGGCANVLNDMVRLDEAYQFFLEQEQLCREHGLRDDLLRCLGNQAIVLSSLGYLHRSHRCLADQAALADTLDNPSQKAHALYSQAVLAQRVNRLEDASTLARQASALAEQYGLQTLLESSERVIQEIARNARQPKLGPDLSQSNQLDWFSLNEQQIREALQSVDSVNLRDRSGRTPLMGAAYQGFFKLVSDLLKREAPVSLRDQDGRTALDYAERNQPQRRQIAETLIEAEERQASRREKQVGFGKPTDRPCRDTVESIALTTQLLLAISQKNTEAVANLLEQGADANKGDSQEFTPLMAAAAHGHRDIVGMLLNHNVQLNVQSLTGTTAIMMAAENGRADIVQMLWEAGGNVGIQDTNGWTALMIAARRGHTPVVQRLLEAGANADVANINGSRAVFYAIEEGKVECVQALLRQHIDLETPNCPGTTVLGLAADRGNPEIVQMLLDAEADVNAANPVNGMTPLHFASQTGDGALVRLLLARGANLNARNRDGIDPLTYAAALGRADVVSLLLEYAATMNLPLDGAGQNVLNLGADSMDWARQGDQAFRAGRLEEARNCFQTAGVLDPANGKVKYNLGVVQIALGNHNAALAAYEQATQLNPQFVEAWYNLGVLHMTQGRDLPAIEAFEKALALKPELQQAWHNKGEALRALGRLPDAMTCFQRALELNPGDTKAQQGQRLVTSELSGGSTPTTGVGCGLVALLLGLVLLAFGIFWVGGTIWRVVLGIVGGIFLLIALGSFLPPPKLPGSNSIEG